MSGPVGAAIGDQRRWNQILSAALAIGFLFHVIPRPRAWTLLHLHKEDGLIFLTDFLERGWGSVFEIYSGYTHILPRILTAVGLSLLPLEWFAVWVGVSVALVKVMIAYLAHGVYRHWVGQGGAALVAASTVLFMPIGQQEVLGNYTNLRWFMPLALVLASLARFSGPWVNSALIGVSLVAVFTEPLTVVALPILLYSAVTARGWQRAPSVVGAVAVVANLTLVLRPGDRGDVLGVTYFLLNPSETVRQVAIRGVAAAEFGQNISMGAMQLVGSHYWLVGFGLLAVLVAMSLRRWSERSVRLGWVLVLAGIAALMATLVHASAEAIDLEQWYAVGQVSRYSSGAALLVLPGMVLIVWPARGFERVWWPGFVGAILSIGLLAGVAMDFRGDQTKASGPRWVASVQAAHAECAVQGTAELKFSPQEDTPIDWTSSIDCRFLLR